MLLSLLPFAPLAQLYASDIIGASGAIYGLLLAYALYFPDRPIYMYFVFPIPAKLFVDHHGRGWRSTRRCRRTAAAWPTPRTSAACSSRSSYLKGLRPRLSPWAEVKYRYVKWKIDRARKKFDVYSGGRSDGRGDSNRWDRRVH